MRKDDDDGLDEIFSCVDGEGKTDCRDVMQEELARFRYSLHVWIQRQAMSKTTPILRTRLTRRMMSFSMVTEKSGSGERKEDGGRIKSSVLTMVSLLYRSGPT